MGREIKAAFAIGPAGHTAGGTQKDQPQSQLEALNTAIYAVLNRVENHNHTLAEFLSMASGIAQPPVGTSAKNSDLNDTAGLVNRAFEMVAQISEELDYTERMLESLRNLA